MPQVSRAPIPLAPLLGLTVLIGCRESSRTGPPEAGSNPVTVSYVCGNDFDIHNESANPVTVGYAVLGTSERGELLLPGGSSGGSTLRLTALHRGTLQLSSGDEQAAPVENGGRTCAAPDWSHRTEAIQGSWSPPFSWPVVAVHLHLLPSGQVLSWGRIGEPQLWDPASGTFTPVPSSTMVFCSGHTFLSDGRLFVAGGHLADLRGLRDVNVFDGSVPSWQKKAKMRWARWYPTSTTLADGGVLTIGGSDETGAQVAAPELWDGESWRTLSGASRVLPYYPRTFVAPNGMVFYAGELAETGYLDPVGGGGWTPVATTHYGRRDYGSAVMYSPGKVLILGGSDPPDGAPTNTAEVIDLNEATPSWRYTGPMAYPRRQLNATLLPDGSVLVTGGTSAPGFSDPAGSVHAAEAWDPGTGHWTLLASGQVDRVYHSTTILLADGRVLHAGSGDGPGLPRQLTAELFSPPYLFRSDRPVITSSPETIGYGQVFAVGTPDGAQVIRVSLVRLGSVTHAFDQSQRFIALTFERTADGLKVTAPASGALAPPGPYLLALLNAAGVPSVARVVRVG
jgi:galactose oxidase